MTAEGFAKVLRAYQRRAPFKPFTVELVTGERILVEHPEALVVRSNVAVHFDTKGEIRMFDHEGVCEVINGKRPKA